MAPWLASATAPIRTGDDDIGPAVAIPVDDDHAATLVRQIHAALPRHQRLERAISATVQEQPATAVEARDLRLRTVVVLHEQKVNAPVAVEVARGDGWGSPTLSLDEGKRWATDVPLRTGMRRIRDAIAPALDANGHPTLDPERARELAASIQDNVKYLIENCKLELRADATLHGLITGLMEGAALLAANPKSANGAAKLVEALREYPKYFEDPDWCPLP